MRDFRFENSEYHHIFNQGVDKRNIFLCGQDYERFVKSMKKFNNNINSRYKDFLLRDQKTIKKALSPRYRELSAFLNSQPKLVEIICFRLLSNHFYFIIKQLQKNGISKFMHKLSMGYANYFNNKYIRTGSLFEGSFKAKYIDTNEYLLGLSVYVNCNVQIHGIIKYADKYKWRGYPEYIYKSKNNICDKNIIVDQFTDTNDYANFVNDFMPEIKERKKLGKYFLE